MSYIYHLGTRGSGAMWFGIAAGAAAFVACITAPMIREGRHQPQHRRHPFPDPADDTDPDGTQYITALHHEAPLPMLPPDPPAAVTGPLPVVVQAWGMTRDELLDDLARKYLEVQR